jgi:hypothetical protein
MSARPQGSKLSFKEGKKLARKNHLLPTGKVKASFAYPPGYIFFRNSNVSLKVGWCDVDWKMLRVYMEDHALAFYASGNFLWLAYDKDAMNDEQTMRLRARQELGLYGVSRP